MRHRFSDRSLFFSTTLIALTCGLAALPVACGESGDTGKAGSGGTGATGAQGGGGEAGSGGTGGQMPACVLDGKKADSEQCDDGNMIAGDGCEPDCSFTCAIGADGDAQCDDMDPCNGAETCSAEHTCASGTALADGSACGAGQICVGGVCQDDTCGDLFVSSGEDCDDGNATAGDGCDPDCTYSCTAADPSKCAPADPCAGVAACDDATHTCDPLVPLVDGAVCPGGYCLGGACENAVCGDGNMSPGEDCDDGNAIDGDGCDTGCVFSCAVPAADCPLPADCQMPVCSPQHTCAEATDPAKQGLQCGGGAGYTCQNGACSAPGAVCGNGAVEMGEECDFGASNGPGTGCEANCTYSCTTSPDSCSDNNPCNGVEVCATVMMGNAVGQACQPGTALADCTACPGGLCGAGACKASSCGDSCLDPTMGEQCEPPGSAVCDAACQTIAVVACGNGTREGTEQCDDGGTLNLDGCDAACKFEQDQRINWLKMQFLTDAFCTSNKLGSAFAGALAQSQVQASIDNSIANGSISVLFKMLDLDDLTGTADPAVNIGAMNGSPVPNMGVPMYNGASDLDWWYKADPTSIDANRDPLASMLGSITAKVLNAGPGTIHLSLSFGGPPSLLKFTQTMMTGTIGMTSVPLTSTGLPPGHLASEQLDPALVSYATFGQPNANGAAKLCGNTSAASLAQAPIPASLIGACAQAYTAQNSILDLLIGGCTIFGQQQIIQVQPDKVDPEVPPAGGGAPYTLSANAMTRVVDTCKDKNNVVVPLQACLDAAAYSSFFKLTTDRVIIK